MKMKLQGSASLGLALLLSSGVSHAVDGTDGLNKNLEMMEKATNEMSIDGSTRAEVRGDGTRTAKVGLRHLKFLTITLGPDGEREFSHQTIDAPLPNETSPKSNLEEQ